MRLSKAVLVYVRRPGSALEEKKNKLVCFTSLVRTPGGSRNVSRSHQANGRRKKSKTEKNLAKRKHQDPTGQKVLRGIAGVCSRNGKAEVTLLTIV